MNKIRLAGFFAIGAMAVAGQVSARENVTTSAHKAAPKTAASAVLCKPATATIDLDINNVRALLLTGGDMWWDQGLAVAAYELPKNSGKHSQFAASCWIGGFDEQKQLKVAAQTYRQDGNDYWPGALSTDGNATISSTTCNLWDDFWKVDKSTINAFITAYKNGGDLTDEAYNVIKYWPATGNVNAQSRNGNLNLNGTTAYAPFVDLFPYNGIYEPDKGEYPDINGDQYIWWVFNDAGNVKEQSQTSAIGVEVQTSAFAYARQDYLNNATFCNYRVINRGQLTIDSTYIAVWDDCDLGYAFDDFIGCDTVRGLGIQYNGTDDDGAGGGHPVNSYGPRPPQVGLDFFQGPQRIVKRTGLPDTIKQLGMTNFTYYDNDGSNIGNPANGVQIYYYMTGSIRNGQRFSDDFNGAGVQSKGYGAGPVSNFVFTGDPGDKSTWSECTCNNNPGDRRFIFSSGPFQLFPGKVNDITFGCVWASGVGGCPNTSFKTIKSIDDGAQSLFESNFKTVEGPNAPRMVCRELDKKLIFYLLNDYGSNNYAENYGRNDGQYNDSFQYHQIVSKAKDISKDSLYRFQGYRVFQLANSQITSAEIFDPTTGEVDNTKAIEVFQCDIHDSVTQLVNYVQNLSISDSTWIPQVVVNGKDSGITHSFIINQDAFATGSNKSLVNYQNYYFVAIAYAYNNFASFNPSPIYSNSTQSLPYIGSSHAAGNTVIPVIAALPNPSAGTVDGVLNSDYGSGVVIHRIEGVGNGGNVVELNQASEDAILSNGFIGEAVYNINQGPIDVKVIDPVRVKPYNWSLQVSDLNHAGTNSGTWTLVGSSTDGAVHDTIFSEENISTLNEQILENYGLSVTVHQVSAPGVDQPGGNGYITSSIIFEDNSKPWLWGVQDGSNSSTNNWIRSGNNQKASVAPLGATAPCNFNDYNKLDTFQDYENLLANFSPTQSTWAPYFLAADYANEHTAGSTGFECGFEVAYHSGASGSLAVLPDVNVVFTSDTSKWTRCAVVEEQDDSSLSDGHAQRFYLRNHAGWDKGTSADGISAVYSDDPNLRGMSWFPGYAINEGTGERLNIVFGEDSYISNDMIWNPTPDIFSAYDGSIIFGGRHVVYVLGSRYDQDAGFISNIKNSNASNTLFKAAYNAAQWIGIPTLNPVIPLLSLRNGIIPTTTTLRFRVDRPYAPYYAVTDTSATSAADPGHGTNPYYTFTTTDLAPGTLSDTTNRGSLLSRIFAVPNPYYGYSGYEQNRLDTKVRIINLPAKTTIYIYSLDGALVRTLTKNDPSVSYIDWDVRNTVGLPVASGMYLMDIKADGIGETVLKWFGATRPIDISTY